MEDLNTHKIILKMKKILGEVKVVFLDKPKMIFPAFKKAYEDKNSYSYLFIEHGDFYNQK